MKLFVRNHNSVLNDVLGEFEIVDRIEDADRVVLWTDTTPVERGIISVARSRKIPTFVVQHGRKGSSRYYPPFNEPIHADKILVWGEFDKRRLVEAEHDPKKILVTGTTVLDHIVPREPHEGTNIIFCPEHWDRPVEENRRVRNKLRRLKGVNITTKIIETHDPDFFDNPIQTHRNREGHLDVCAQVLSTADLVVGISESTFELMAQAMDIPVVIMTEWTPKAFGGDTRYVDYQRLTSKASKHATMKTLNEAIQSQLRNPEELREQRRLVSIDEGGVGLNAYDNITDAIRKG